MRFTTAREAEVREFLRRHPDECLTITAMERPDGAVVIRRDGLEVRLHRYLYRAMVGELETGTFLLRVCTTRGCVNPTHYHRARRPRRGRLATECPNGHAYTDANTLRGGRDRCKACRDARNARRRKTGQRAGYCKNEHKLTKANTYVWTDKNGRAHRRCRTCKLAAVRAARKDAA